MLFQLASLNPDIQKLLDRGYALRIDSNNLVVRDIPYLDAAGDLQWGAIVSTMNDIDGSRVLPHDHQVFFSGGGALWSQRQTDPVSWWRRRASPLGKR